MKSNSKEKLINDCRNENENENNKTKNMNNKKTHNLLHFHFLPFYLNYNGLKSKKPSKEDKEEKCTFHPSINKNKHYLEANECASKLKEKGKREETHRRAGSQNNACNFE